LRHDALGYDVRFEVFGTADSHVVGLDARAPLHAPGEPARRALRGASAAERSRREGRPIPTRG